MKLVAETQRQEEMKKAVSVMRTASTTEGIKAELLKFNQGEMRKIYLSGFHPIGFVRRKGLTDEEFAELIARNIIGQCKLNKKTKKA